MRFTYLSSALAFGLLALASCANPAAQDTTKPTYTLAQDSYEDTDVAGYRTTNQLGAGSGSKQVHSIFDANKSANDIDYLYFNAVAGKSYRIATSSEKGDTVDTVLELKSPTSTTVATNDNGNGTLAVIDWWECTTSGAYVILVTGRSTGYYGISLEVFDGGKVQTPYTQNFESTPPAPWTAWRIDDVVTHSGTKSIRTAAIGANGTTRIQLMVDVPAGGKTASFYWKVNSEANKDLFRFSVDGEVASTISGNVAWTGVTKALTAGVHVLQWEYSKNKSGTADYDSGWLDDIQIQ